MTLGKSMGLAAALLTGLAAFAVAPAARAADLGGGYKEVERGHGYSLWNGYYGGLHVGYGFGRKKSSVDAASPTAVPIIAASPAFFPTSYDLATEGVVLGGQVGRNWLHGQWVYGVEFDMAYSKLQGVDSFTNAAGNFNSSVDHSINWLSTLRGRVGMLVHPSTLIYGTAGLAFGETTLHSDWGFLTAPACAVDCGQKTTSRISTGYTVGAGMEHALNGWASLKVEYLYVDLGKQSHVNTDSFNPAISFKFNAQNTTNLLRAGMNFKF